jgi:hypothetical protein
MEEYLLSQLDTPVVLKDGTMMTKPDKVVTLAATTAATSRAVAVRTRAGGWSRRPLNIEH